MPESVRFDFFVRTGSKPIAPNIPQLDNTTAIWTRSIDLQRGTHVVPPQLGSGLWVSDELPNEGVLIQQQGERVVFYRLGYGPATTDAGNLAGTWVYADATFDGDSGNGIAVHFARPDPDDPSVVMEEVFSSSIIVDDVNHVRTLFDAGPREISDPLSYTHWRRWNFDRDSRYRPAVLPDFSGSWTLLRFEGGTELDRSEISFDDGASLDEQRWRFESLDGSADLVCAVDNLGEGECLLTQSLPAEAMRFEIADFNGNLAEGRFIAPDGTAGNDALLLRQPFSLAGAD